MEVTRTETREVQVVEDVICDRCGNSLKSDIGNINGAVISGGGGYDSTHFPDMHSFKSDAIWYDPNDLLRETEYVDVLLNPDNPKVHEVDISFLPKDA